MEGFTMRKKFFVRLSKEEREILLGVTKRLSGTSQKVRRANILLKADADGPNWKDSDIAEAYGCRPQTVENVRRRLVTIGFEETLNGAVRREPPTPKKLDGRQEAQIIALRLGPAPKGYSGWSLRLLAKKAVEFEIVKSISYETVRLALKKTVSQIEKCSIG
jgi:hypothetical protein